MSDPPLHPLDTGSNSIPALSVSHPIMPQMREDTEGEDMIRDILIVCCIGYFAELAIKLLIRVIATLA